MDYRTYIPDPVLSSLVRCFWSLDIPASALPEKQRIIPDGCMEMIVHYGDLFRQFHDGGTSIIQPRSFVFGQITSVLEIAPVGVTGIVAARFQPDGFTPFITIPLSEMENRAVPLTELFGDAGSQLEKDVLDAGTNEARVQVIENFLTGRLNTPAGIDFVARSSVDVLLGLKGQLKVGELAGQLGTGRRQLERRFATVIGLSPKQLSKIIRLQSTLKMLEEGRFTNLAALACENGYFDQAHFIKDFREFTGMSPRQFYADSLKMSALFIGAE